MKGKGKSRRRRGRRGDEKKSGQVKRKIFSPFTSVLSPGLNWSHWVVSSRPQDSGTTDRDEETFNQYVRKTQSTPQTSLSDTDDTKGSDETTY